MRHTARQYADPASPIAFAYPAEWILVVYPPMHAGGAFFDLHTGISALESTPREDTGLVAYKPGDFSLRLLVYRDGWQGDAYQTVRVEAQRLHQYHYQVSEPARFDIGAHAAAQVTFTNMRVRDGAFIVFGLDAQRWVLASLSAAVTQLPQFLPAAYDILASVRVAG